MANVLTKFLVGIGWDKKEFDQDSKGIERSFGGIKTTALAVGAGIAAALAGGTAIAINASREIDQLNLKTQNLNTSAQYAYNLGNALKLVGGNAEDAMGAISGIEQLLTNYKLGGETGKLDQLALAGVDNIYQLANSSGSSEFLSILAEQMQGMSNNDLQKVQETLGLSDAMMKALGSGPQQFEALMSRAASLTGEIDGMSEQSRKLQFEMARFGLIMDGLSNDIAERVIPSFGSLVTWINDTLEDNKGNIIEAVDYSVNRLEENPIESAAIAGYSTSLLGLPLAFATSYAADKYRDIFGDEEIPPSSESAQYTGTIIRDKSDPAILKNEMEIKLILDGNALETKIMEVNERVSFETVEDLSSTTVR